MATKKKVDKKVDKKKAVNLDFDLSFVSILSGMADKYSEKIDKERVKDFEKLTAKDGVKYAEEVFYPMFKEECRKAASVGEYSIENVYVFYGCLKGDEDGFVLDSRCSQKFLETVLKRASQLGNEDGLDIWCQRESSYFDDLTCNRGQMSADWG